MNNIILSLVKMNGNKVINPPDNERRLLLKFTMQIKQTRLACKEASETVLCACVVLASVCVCVCQRTGSVCLAGRSLLEPQKDGVKLC